MIPKWLQPLGGVIALLVAALLISGVLMVPFRSIQPPHGEDQSRMHFNTKNSTRFTGDSLAEVAGRVSRAVYPEGGPLPQTVLLYQSDDWQSAVMAASYLRPLQAVLLPDVAGIQAEIERLGSPDVLRLGADITLADLAGQAGRNPEHVIVVEDDPAIAVLAAPWAAYSGDRIVFDPADIPEGIPVYTLGDVLLENVTYIAAGDPADVAVSFAAYEDPTRPNFGWGFNADSLTGYRAYSIAPVDDPALGLLSANLAVRGKIGPLLWSESGQLLTNQPARLPQVVNNYLFSQRAAFWFTPSEGPFHHFWILGGTESVSYVAQSQADYTVEIGPYKEKGVGMAGMDMLAAGWVLLGLASAIWIYLHQYKFLPDQNWVMRLAWPLFALIVGPFGIPIYYLAYQRPVMRMGDHVMWDRPLWLQGLVGTVSAVGFGATLMIATGYVIFVLGVPVIPNQAPGLFLLGTPMILIMILNYESAVLVSWLVFQTPMLAMFYQRSYAETLRLSLPLVLISMTTAALAMNPGMWWLMMWNLPMMPTEESILWFGVMFFTGFMAFLLAWPFNYALVRAQRKSGLM